MDNKLEFIKNLKELFKEYNIFNCFNTPEFMADELSEKLQIIIDDYKKKEAIASDDIQKIVNEVTDNIIKMKLAGNELNTSYNIEKLTKGPLLLEGETSLDKRITRLKNVYEIYRDNVTKDKYIIIRYADNIVITVKIDQCGQSVIKFYKCGVNYKNEKVQEWNFFAIDYLKILSKEKVILNNKLLIKELVKKPIIEEGTIACNGRIIRYKDKESEVYFDRKTKQSIKVTRLANQVLIECRENGHIEFDRLFINGVELTKEEYIEQVIKNNIPNIFPKHYVDIQEEYLYDPEIIESIIDSPILEIGCQSYEGRIYRAINPEEIYIDVISMETLKVNRSRKDNNEYVTITKDDGKEIIYLNNEVINNQQKVKKQ